MRRAPVLAGAGAAAVLLTAAAAVGLLQDDDVRGCAATRAAISAANGTYLDALAALDRALVRAQGDGDQQAGVPAVRQRTEQTKAELEAARAVHAQLCRKPGATAPTAPRREP